MSITMDQWREEFASEKRILETRIRGLEDELTRTQTEVERPTLSAQLLHNNNNENETAILDAPKSAPLEPSQTRFPQIRFNSTDDRPKSNSQKKNIDWQTQLSLKLVSLKEDCAKLDMIIRRNVPRSIDLEKNPKQIATAITREVTTFGRLCEDYGKKMSQDGQQNQRRMEELLLLQGRTMAFESDALHVLREINSSGAPRDFMMIGLNESYDEMRNALNELEKY